MIDTPLEKLHPAEAAEKLLSLPEEEAARGIEALEPNFAADILESLDAWQSAGFFAELPVNFQSKILEKMDPDDSVDLLQELRDKERDDLLGRLDRLTRKRLRSLLEYPAGTAGGMMSPEVLSLPEDVRVGEGVEKLREKEKNLEEVNYVYVTADGGALKGVLPLRNFAFKEPDLKLRDVMNPDVKTVKPELDREEVARLFDRYDYLALPVVNDYGKLLGIITVDDVLDVLRQEDTEDMLEMVGIGDAREESLWTPWRTSVKHRLPWLVVNLGTAILAALVVGYFEDTISRFAVLAVFMPVIAGQGGNSGTQTVSLLVRGIALGEIKVEDSVKALIKEASLGLLHGVSIGLLVGVIAFAWTGSLRMSFVVGLAMLLSMVVAGIAGVAIPMGLKKIGLDPALSANIWMTTVTDVASFAFLLGLASWLLL